MSKPVTLRKDDVVCRDCGRRSRPGYDLPAEPCYQGDSTDSAHDWVLYGGLTDGDD